MADGNGQTVRRIETEAEARAMMVFLTKERQRHLADVCQIDVDRRALAERWSLDVPAAVVDRWWTP